MPLIIPFGSHRVATVGSYLYTGTTALRLGGASTSSLSQGALAAITETWDAPDATGTLDGVLDWDDYINSSHLWNVVAGRAVLTGGGQTSGGRVVAPLPTSDYQVTATIATWTDSGAGVMAFGPCARMQGDTSLTFYCATLLTVDGVSTVIIQKFLAGSSTTLGTPAPVTPHAGMQVTTRCAGATVTALFDMVPVVTAVDPTPIATGLYWGQQGYMTAGNAVAVETIAASQAVYQFTAARGTLTLTGPATGMHTTRRLPASRRAFALTGYAAAFDRPNINPVIGGAIGQFHLTGPTTRLIKEHRLVAETGALTLTGRDADRLWVRPTLLANTVDGNPWVVTLPTSAPLQRGRVRVLAVRWVGASAAYHRVVITDGTGHRVWSSVADMAHHTEYDYLDGRLYTDVTVPILDSGTLEIEVG